MRAVCVTVLGDYARATGAVSRGNERARQHLGEYGIAPQFFYGIHAERLGLAVTKPYEVDHPGSGYRMTSRPCGCWLSHRALWAALLLLEDDLVLVLEDDVRLDANWRDVFPQAVADAGDFDMLFVGSCCTQNKPTRHVAGRVYETQWPLCTHAYVVRRRALMTLIETQDATGLYAPVDIALGFHSLPHLKAYTVLPRIADQFETELPP